jgi:hypothetical protein
MGEKASEATRLVTVFHFNRQQLRNEKNSFVARPTTMPAPVWSEKVVLFHSIRSELATETKGNNRKPVTQLGGESAFADRS